MEEFTTIKKFIDKLSVISKIYTCYITFIKSIDFKPTNINLRRELPKDHIITANLEFINNHTINNVLVLELNIVTRKDSILIESDGTFKLFNNKLNIYKGKNIKENIVINEKEIIRNTSNIMEHYDVKKFFKIIDTDYLTRRI